MTTNQSLPSLPLPTLRFPENSTVIPGDRIGTIRQLRAGQGCYVRQGHIYSTLVGKLQLVTLSQQVVQEENDEEDQKEETVGKRQRPPPPFVCNVVPVSTTTAGTGRSSSTSSGTATGIATISATSYVLKPGQLVLGRVVRITPQNAVVTIKAAEHVGALPKQLQLEGMIRTEDVRALASEQVQIHQSFQPGDLVAARVISLGDSRRYHLSTAETELGVIRATASQDGGLQQQQVLGSGSLQKRKRVEDRFLKPISFKEMEDPVTGIKERRKVAKPLLLTTTLGV